MASQTEAPNPQMEEFNKVRAELEARVNEVTILTELGAKHDELVEYVGTLELPGTYKIKLRSIVNGLIEERKQQIIRGEEEPVAPAVAAPAPVVAAGIEINDFEQNINSANVKFYRLPNNGGYYEPHRDPDWIHNAAQNVVLSQHRKRGLFEALQHVKEDATYNNYYLVCPTYTGGGIFADCQLSVTGKRKDGETIDVSVKRELEEEIGLTFAAYNPVFQGNYNGDGHNTHTCVMTEATTQHMNLGDAGDGGIVARAAYPSNDAEDNANYVQTVLIVPANDEGECEHVSKIRVRRFVTIKRLAAGGYDIEKIPAVTCIPLNRIEVNVNAAGHGVITINDPAAVGGGLVKRSAINSYNGLIPRFI